MNRPVIMATRGNEKSPTGKIILRFPKAACPIIVRVCQSRCDPSLSGLWQFASRNPVKRSRSHARLLRHICSSPKSASSINSHTRTRPKIRLGKCLSDEFSISQAPFPICPKSNDVRRAQCEKVSGVKYRLFSQILRKKDCPAFFAEISPVACPSCVAHLKSGKNIVTYA
jgi:hypothetical protein